MEITPAILAKSIRDFAARIESPLFGIAPRVHIDVMDGSFTSEHCISHPELIPSDFTADIELHLMVDSPIAYLEEWSHIPLVQSVIIHAEIDGDVVRALLTAKDLGYSVLLGLSPHTPLSVIDAYLPHIDGVLLMGVIPGASGQPFLGDLVLERARFLRTKYPSLSLVLDGGLRPHMIPPLRQAGISRACASSAIWNSDLDPLVCYKRLTFL